MRIFSDALEMVKEVERDLFEMGIQVQSSTMQDKDVHDDEGYSTLELFSYGYMVTAPEKIDDMVEYLKGSMRWLVAELMERLAPEYLNPGKAWELRREVWEEFIHDGQFAYTYNERYRDQLDKVVMELQKRLTTRQAIITMYDRHQDMMNLGGHGRIPCSMYYQFYIRKDQLHAIYTMRSCDFLTHFAHDVWLAMKLQEHIARHVGLPVGTFTHFVGSLHAYKKDMDARGIF